MAQRRQPIERCVQHLEHARRAPPRTVAAYKRDLEQLARFAAEQLGRSPKLEQVDTFLLRRWLGTLARRTTPSTIARKLAAVRACGRWLVERGELKSDPAAVLQSPKVSRPLPTFLNAEAAASVVATPSTSHPAGLRGRAM